MGIRWSVDAASRDGFENERCSCCAESANAAVKSLPAGTAIQCLDQHHTLS